ncbi:putative endonuclease-reverse transcriptase [Trichonephila clavipes]|nr:putative endonuclease-reverse transcriptase [Trichonephila clavipes]
MEEKKLYDLIQEIWEQEVIPKEWKMSTTYVIHKKGDILECSNYRGISLLCTSSKVFSNILFNRLSPQVENTVGDYQNGFRKGRSPTEQIFNIRQVLEKTRELTCITFLLILKLLMIAPTERLLLQP